MNIKIPMEEEFEFIELKYHDYVTPTPENKENGSFSDIFSCNILSKTPQTPTKDPLQKKRSLLIEEKIEIEKQIERVDAKLKKLLLKKENLLKEDKRISEEIQNTTKIVNNKIPLQILSQDYNRFPPPDKVTNPITCMQTRRKLISSKDLSFETLRGHTDSILSCAISYSNSKIISGSKDCSINIWNLKDYQLLYNIKNHQGWIKYLHCDKHLLYAGSGDKTFSIVSF